MRKFFKNNLVEVNLILKTVLVTGSSRGIGKAIAKIFLENNFRVCINSHKNLFELEETLQEFENKFSKKKIMAVQADVSKYEKCLFLFDEIQKKFSDVDILINNAGISYFGLFNLMKKSEWKNILDVNLNSVINCSHIAIQSMIKKKSGVIINISSIWGKVGASCETIYSTAKGAVNLFTKSLAKELAPEKIRINAIACGMIDTQMNNIFDDEEKKNIKMQIPMDCFGNVDDVANLTFFLASDKSKYITGQIINLDGGWI